MKCLLVAAVIPTLYDLAVVAREDVNCDIPLPDHIIDCGWYKQYGRRRNCIISQYGKCVNEGWFSKNNRYGQRHVNANQICIDQGYEGADEVEWGGNWKRRCGYPGQYPTLRLANNLGGSITNMGSTVTWKCKGEPKCPAKPPNSMTYNSIPYWVRVGRLSRSKLKRPELPNGATYSPTVTPTMLPSFSPSIAPTVTPSITPSLIPTAMPFEEDLPTLPIEQTYAGYQIFCFGINTNPVLCEFCEALQSGPPRKCKDVGCKGQKKSTKCKPNKENKLRCNKIKRNDQLCLAMGCELGRNPGKCQGKVFENKGGN